MQRARVQPMHPAVVLLSKEAARMPPLVRQAARHQRAAAWLLARSQHLPGLLLLLL